MRAAKPRKKSAQKRRTQVHENPYQIFIKTLRTWAASAPPDMRGEPPREKLLDAMLRLFEALDAAGLKTAKPDPAWLAPLVHAVRWQLLVLDIPAPPGLEPAASYVLALAAARWLPIWQSDKTMGQSRLMAAIDRDLNRLDAAAQHWNRLWSR